MLGITVLYFNRLYVSPTLFNRFVPYFPSCEYGIYLVVVVVVAAGDHKTFLQAEWHHFKCRLCKDLY